MVQIKRFLFKGLNHDTCWDITNSPDGYIYVGSCMEHTSGGIAILVQFDPIKENLRYVATYCTTLSGRQRDKFSFF